MLLAEVLTALVNTAISEVPNVAEAVVSPVGIIHGSVAVAVVQYKNLIDPRLPLEGIVKVN
jgi:acyl-coenzyme A synthetase/AMP-(fatty) acid ligase